MRFSALIVVLAACEEHGSSPCPGGVCTDGGKPGGEGVVTFPDAGCFDGFEPNDMLTTAFTVPLLGGSFSAVGLAICPDGELDHFAVDIPTPNLSLAVAASFDGSPLLLSILNAAGTSIANGIGTGSDTQACVPNLPAGKFFVQLTNVGGFTDYRLSISAVAVCP